jgi:hypothetical protein
LNSPNSEPKQFTLTAILGGVQRVRRHNLHVPHCKAKVLFVFLKCGRQRFMEQTGHRQECFMDVGNPIEIIEVTPKEIPIPSKLPALPAPAPEFVPA